MVSGVNRKACGWIQAKQTTRASGSDGRKEGMVLQYEFRIVYSFSLLTTIGGMYLRYGTLCVSFIVCLLFNLQCHVRNAIAAFNLFIVSLLRTVRYS